MDPIVKAGILLILSYENPHNGYSKTKESKFCSGEAIISGTGIIRISQWCRHAILFLFCQQSKS